MAEVGEEANGFQIKLWQGEYDLPTRKWKTPPKCQAVSGILPNKSFAWAIAKELASDVGAVDIVMTNPN